MGEHEHGRALTKALSHPRPPPPPITCGPPPGRKTYSGWLVGVFRNESSPTTKGVITASRRMGTYTDGSDETSSINQPCMPARRQGVNRAHRYPICLSIHPHSTASESLRLRNKAGVSVYLPLIHTAGAVPELAASVARSLATQMDQIPFSFLPLSPLDSHVPIRRAATKQQPSTK